MVVFSVLYTHRGFPQTEVFNTKELALASIKETWSTTPNVTFDMMDETIYRTQVTVNVKDRAPKSIYIVAAYLNTTVTHL